MRRLKDKVKFLCFCVFQEGVGTYNFKSFIAQLYIYFLFGLTCVHPSFVGLVAPHSIINPLLFFNKYFTYKKLIINFTDEFLAKF